MSDNAGADHLGKGVKAASLIPNMLTPKEAASRMKVSVSFLAKHRMAGTGPRFVRVGRAIRYLEPGILEYMKSRQRSSTSEPW